MAAEAPGYVKLYRRLVDKPIWLQSTPEQKAVLIAILLMANFKEQEWLWQGTKYLCQPGQFVSSLEGIAKRCGKGVSARNVRTALEKFQNLGFLTSEASNQGRLVTVVNWRVFQQDEEEAVKQPVRYQSNDSQAPVRHQSTSKKERRKESNKANKYIPYEDIVSAFNCICIALPKVMSLTNNRKSVIAARWEDLASLEAVEDFFRRVAASDYLCGRVNTFTASFDWIFKEANFVKVREGNYDNREKPPDSPAVASLRRFLSGGNGDDQANGR